MTSPPSSSLAYLFAKNVSIKFDTPKGLETTTGRVVKITQDVLAVKGHSGITLVDIDKIIGEINIENRRKKMFRRELRDMGGNVRKHLADRHSNMFVSVLNAIDEGTAKKMHDRIPHGPLGHVHAGDETKPDAKKRVKLARAFLNLSEKSVRQHLNDRHGVMYDILNSVDEAMAKQMHSRIDHKDLIHFHEHE